MTQGWPTVSYDQWGPTCDTLHAHTQVLGKLAVELAPPEAELQHAALRLTARGFQTAPLPAPDGSGSLVVALDLRSHAAVVEYSGGGEGGRGGEVGGVCRWPRTGRSATSPGRCWPRWPGWPEACRSTRRLAPAAASWDPALGEYILDWDDVGAASDPLGAALDFAHSAFRHACLVGGWDPALPASADGSPPPIR